MRFTQKSKKYVNSYEWNRELITKTFVQMGLNKLGQLEDILQNHNIETLEELDGLLCYVKQIIKIEEELGINLITLFKALKNGVFVKYEKNHWRTKLLGKEDGCIEHFPIVKITAFGMIDVSNPTHSFSQNYFTKDYGITWALTKEELL